MGRRSYALAGAVSGAVVVALVSACTTGGGSGSDSGSAQGAKLASKITIGLSGTPTTLDPFGLVSPPGTYFYHEVYDGLTAFSPGGTLTPGLATSWTSSDDTTWKFTLRTTAQFSNGEKVTASGVKSDLDYLRSHLTEPDSAEVAAIASIAAPSPGTLVITTSGPDPILLSQLTAVPIPAPKAFAANPAAFASKAIGTGPYEVSSYSSAQSLNLSAAPHSWRGKPKTAAIDFISIPDPATRVAALKSGQIDVAQNIGPDDIAGLRTAGDTVKEIRRGQIQQVMFEAATHPGSPINKLPVRLALNYAIDAPTIIKTVLGGAFTPSFGQTVAPGAVGYNPNVTAYPYDPAKAKQMLAAAGYPHGFTVSLEETTGAFPNDAQAYEAVVSELQAAGLKVNVQTVPLPQFVTALRAGPRAELFIAGLQYIPELDTAKAMSWWLCSAKAAAKRNCDPKLDAVMAQAGRTTSPPARGALLQQANAIFHADAFSIPLWQLTDIWAMRKGVSGWVDRPDAVLDLNVLTATAG